MTVYDKLLMRVQPQGPPISAAKLTDLFAVFHEWEFLGIGDKRRLLRSTLPQIHVQDYRVVGLSLAPELMRGDEVNHTGTGSSPRLA